MNCAVCYKHVLMVSVCAKKRVGLIMGILKAAFCDNFLYLKSCLALGYIKWALHLTYFTHTHIGLLAMFSPTPVRTAVKCF